MGFFSLYSAMKITDIFGKTLLNKCFSKMSHDLKSVLTTLLFNAAESNDYLENVTSHADAIHWHLNNIEFDDFISSLNIFFIALLKILRKQNLGNLTIAFDETFIPFYGRQKDFWVHGYTNNVKGARGSYKIMSCSIVLHEKRFVLYSVPMHIGQDTANLVEEILTLVKKYLRVNMVLLDRGFFNKRLVHKLEAFDSEYIMLIPKAANIKKYLKNHELEVVEYNKYNENKTNYPVEIRYLFAYNFEDKNWVFVSNSRMNILAMLLTYKGRWGIETSFRVMDLSDIKSKSTNIIIRSFFFLVSVLLYNSWIFIREEKPMTYKTFLENTTLATASADYIIERWKWQKEN